MAQSWGGSVLPGVDGQTDEAMPDKWWSVWLRWMLGWSPPRWVRLGLVTLQDTAPMAAQHCRAQTCGKGQ